MGDGFHMWLRRIYILLRLYVNMNVYVGSVLVCVAAINNAYKFIMRILGYPSKRATILTRSGSLKTLAPAILSFPSPCGGVNEPSV